MKMSEQRQAEDIIDREQQFAETTWDAAEVLMKERKKRLNK